MDEETTHIKLRYRCMYMPLYSYMYMYEHSIALWQVCCIHVLYVHQYVMVSATSLSHSFSISPYFLYPPSLSLPPSLHLPIHPFLPLAPPSLPPSRCLPVPEHIQPAGQAGGGLRQGSKGDPDPGEHRGEVKHIWKVGGVRMVT